MTITKTATPRTTSTHRRLKSLWKNTRTTGRYGIMTCGKNLGRLLLFFHIRNIPTHFCRQFFREWVKWSDGDAPPEGWYIAAARKKPGVEAYIYPSPVVSVTRYYKKREKAAIDVRRIASLQAPGFCFGYSQERINWIISSSGMSRQGRLWTVTTEHMYASEGWDIELYA